LFNPGKANPGEPPNPEGVALIPYGVSRQAPRIPPQSGIRRFENRSTPAIPNHLGVFPTQPAMGADLRERGEASCAENIS